MDRNMELIVYGVLVWLIPFLVSWPLYSPKGEPLYDLQVIRSILIVVGSLVGALLALRYFRDTEKDLAREGAILGISWFVINSVLDIIVLVYLLKGMDLSAWAGQTGIRYILVPS